MPQSLASILIRIVFSTKNRAPTIVVEHRSMLHAYVTGMLKHLQCRSLQTGGTADHLHLLLALARTRSVADVIEQTKKSSSKWMKRHGATTFAWQAGYGAFSIGESQAADVVRYIARQEEHHRRLTFADELRKLLALYRIPYDERYVWD